MLCLLTFFSSCFSAVLYCHKEMMRRKRSCTAHQASIVNVHAVVLGLDGVGKSGKFKVAPPRIIDNYCESLNHLGTCT